MKQAITGVEQLIVLSQTKFRLSRKVTATIISLNIGFDTCASYFDINVFNWISCFDLHLNWSYKFVAQMNEITLNKTF